ncbi:hypothetical protein C7S18_23715 (plasmid) [Ahniella affigens]|uniref:Uncharacterized protein n=1 Tax=Ahniella affigens TaxID=2021234 RepID=A0A2P1PZP3_9GAMM|nr:hypothetical protein [Ahniella affigens]AVQ00308.1 hypothetical protein C7S18_23715 [Ahniella affigens]
MRILLMLVLIIAASESLAQQTLFRQSSPIIPVLPENGGYFDPTKPGNGIMVEVADDGFVFGAFFYYDALGIGKWNTVQGFCVPVSEQVRMTTDVICKVTPTAMFEARDGQCWGCPWRQNTNFVSTDMNTNVEVVFFAPNRGELRANGAVLPLRRLSEVYPGQTVRDRLLGQWDRVRFRKARDCTGCAEYTVAQKIGAVEVRPITARKNFVNVARPAGFENPTIDSLPVFPADNVPQYEVVCIDNAGANGGTGSCTNFTAQTGQASGYEVFYEEQSSGAIREVSLCPSRSLPDCEIVDGQIGAIVIRNALDYRRDVYVSKGRIVVRGTTQVAGEFVIQEEEVWTKRDSTRTVPIATAWPF